MKIKNKENLTKKGFTLLEILVAMFIFALVVTTASLVFEKSVKGYQAAKAIQKNMESAQEAMNFLAKSLRTSSVVKYNDSDSSPHIRVYDYSQQKCIRYEFSSQILYISSIPIEDSGKNDPVSWCLDFDDSDFLPTRSVMATGATGAFKGIAKSQCESTPAESIVGRITIEMLINCPSAECSGNQSDRARLQTTVSLRDYNMSGLR